MALAALTMDLDNVYIFIWGRSGFDIMLEDEIASSSGNLL